MTIHRSAMRALLPLALLSVAGCAEEDSPHFWSPALTACDAREPECAAALAEGLSLLFGAPTIDRIRVLPTTAPPEPLEPPAPDWRASLSTPPSLFDGSEADPPLPALAGRVQRLGIGYFRFEVDPDITEDAARRHRLGFIAGYARHMRARLWPGHPVDLGTRWPTQRAMRSGLYVATAHLIERAIQRADAGETPWAFSDEDRAWAEDLRARTADAVAVALVALIEGNRADEPLHTLSEVSADAASQCLIGVDRGEPARCVQMRPQSAARIGDLHARPPSAADGVLLERSLRAIDHPAAALAPDLVGHIGRYWHEATGGAAARTDGFLFATAAQASAFGEALGEALDTDDRWASTGPDRWVAEDEAGTGIALDVSGERVVWVGWAGVRDGFDPGAFVDRASSLVDAPLADDEDLDDAPCADGKVPLPCDVRARCCRERLVDAVGRLLGRGMPPVTVRLRDAEAVRDVSAAWRWADDRLAGRVEARARFASGIEHTLEDDTDAAAADADARVSAYYIPDSRTIVLRVPPGDGLTEQDLWSGCYTLVHELAHAWQDLHYGLSARTEDAFRRSADAFEAWATVFEGHATFAVDLFANQHAASPGTAGQWRALATIVRGRLVERADDLEQPARDGHALLRYAGGRALAIDTLLDQQAERFAEDPDRVVEVDHGSVADALFNDSPLGSADVLAALYGGAPASPIDDLSLPTAVDDTALADLITAHRARLGPWALTLRLTDVLGFEAATRRAIRLGAGHELVLLTEDEQTIFWFEGHTDDVSALAGALDAWGARLAERAGQIYRVVGDDDRARLVVAPDEALAERVLDGVHVVYR